MPESNEDKRCEERHENIINTTQMIEIPKKGFTSRLLVTIIAAIIITYFYPRLEQNRFKYEEGRPWSYAKLIAPFDIPIHPDSASIKKAKDSISQKFIPIYTFNANYADSVIANLRGLDNLSKRRVSAAITHFYNNGVVDNETGEKIVAGKLDTVRIINGNVINKRSTSAMVTERTLYKMLDSMSTPSQTGLARSNLKTLIKPNVAYDESTSQQLMEQELLPYTSDRGVIQQGQTIIDKGTIISAQDYINLQTYEQMRDDALHSSSQNDMLILGGQALFVVILVTALLLYFYIFAIDIYNNMRAYIYILVLLIGTFLFAVVMDRFFVDGVYIVPLALVPIMVLVFFDARTALFVSVIDVLLCSAFVTFPLEFIFLEITGGMAAIYTLRELSQRSQLLRTACFIALTYWVAYIALELMLNGSTNGFQITMIGYLAINAALISFAYILMFVAEKVFGFTSIVTLVELADINNSLLRELSDKCPGTFQHSMAVSNMASDAAAKIGANVQLVRAGALYHDLGKMSNPAFFTENQGGVNPHESLPPTRSAEIVINHVNDGLKIADKAKLPSVIKDFIKEHHGRGQAKYFYFTYCQQHPEEKVDPAPFTYPGPNPQSRETSIMMMADAVEAASRSLKEHTAESVTNLVNKIIDGQIADGLHNDSPLSFKDIAIIKDTFIKRLKTMYHARIAYPDDPNKKQQNEGNAQ